MTLMESEASDRSCAWMQGLFNRAGLGDIDDFFAYETVKMVRVRDFRLGLISYLFKIAIVLYIVIYGVVIRQGYLRLEQIQAGSVILNTKAPIGNNSLSPDQLAYCCNSTTWMNCDVPTLPCLYWDEYQSEFPVGKDYSTVVTSRVNITNQEAFHSTDPSMQCTSTKFFYGCSYRDVGNHSAFYIANAEDFTIRIRHAVRGQVITRSGANTGDNAMHGTLKNLATGEVVRSWPDNSRPYSVDQSDTRSGDIVSVRELLQASNTNVNQDTATGASIRYDGLNVIVYINYETVGSSSLRYTYQPRTLTDAEFKVEETIYADNGKRRQILNRHGVRFIFVQTGELGQFDFLTLMTTIVTGFALLAVATTITNFIMLKFLAYRNLYKAHKYEVTEDFSVWRGMDKTERNRRLDIAREVGTRGIEIESQFGIKEPAFLQSLDGTQGATEV
eukprot:m.131488 g.131488  ORF g.131488 m.131488 type:complete len:445 (+) comp15745_c0_seq4:124-1458(+)